MTTDEELLGAWRQGDSGAGEELFSRYSDAVYRFFRTKITGGIEDLMQRTFLATIEGRNRIREDGGFRGYLFGSARNLLFKEFRSRYREDKALDLLKVTSATVDGPRAHSAPMMSSSRGVKRTSMGIS